ncbi:MAG: membrane protein insertase YidC [Myxococcales bacterium]|nr:membrane protein insertase YidC [Myxococcales bacterium]
MNKGGLFGGGDPEDQKRMLMAVALSAAILIGWSVLFPSTPPVKPAQPVDGTPASSAASAAASPASAAGSVAPTPAAAPIERKIVATLDAEGRFHVDVTNADGQLARWDLDEVQYQARDDKGEPAGPYGLVAPLTAESRRGIFLPPLVQVGINGEARPGDYQVVSKAGDRVQLRWTDGATGLAVERTLSLRPDTYGVDVQVKLTNTGNAPVAYDLAALLRAAQNDEEASGSMFSPPLYAFEAVCRRGDDFERMPVNAVADALQDEDDPTRFDDGVTWAGVNSRYFMVSAPVGAAAKACEFFLGPKAAGVDPSAVPPRFTVITTRIELGGGTLAPGASYEQTVPLYGGPKKLDVLRKREPSMADAIDFGFFAPLSEPMLWVMRTIYKGLPNWGLAIILLTVLVKLLTLPLTHKQYKSMAGMRKVQPQLQALQAKYKDDKVKLQQEMMALYKTHNVNPLSGCLPMLLMMPIYFALYRTIYSAVELYQADFFLWLKDLSQPDPYFITPVLLGVLMVVQTRLNPTTGTDATQQKIMMWVMPIMFSGMMLFLPSGLVVYIFVNTVLGLVQQLTLYKRMMPEPVAAR